MEYTGEEPGREDDQDSIRNCERRSTQPTRKRRVEKEGRAKEDENQPDVSSPILKPDAKRDVILVPNCDGTIPTERGSRQTIGRDR